MHKATCSIRVSLHDYIHAFIYNIMIQPPKLCRYAQTLLMKVTDIAIFRGGASRQQCLEYFKLLFVTGFAKRGLIHASSYMALLPSLALLIPPEK